MPVDFFTGFEGCSTTAQMDGFLNAKGSSDVYLSLTNGWDSGKCITWTRSTGRQNAWFRINCEAGKTKVIGWHTRGFGDQAGYDSRAPAQLLQIRSGTSQIVEIFYSTTQGIQVYRTGTLIASDDTVVIDWAVLRHVEIRIVSHASEGSVQIKLDQEFIFEAFNLNTSGTDITSVSWGSAWGYPIVWDNIFIADEWQGELKSHLLLPTADDAVQFTPSSGSDNYALLQSNDGNTSYVESDVVDEQDMYEFGPDLGLFEVHAVSIVSVARKTDVGARNLQVVMEYDGVEHDLASHSLSESFPSGIAAGLVQCHGEPPAGGEWAQDLINSMKLGFKVA